MRKKPKVALDGRLALFAGVFISGISAWYSISGLTSIFAGAFWSIIIMGTALELGKVITAAYLYRNWKDMPLIMKSYFTASVIVLMFITSMGTFGYLSRAHIEQTSSAYDVEAKLERVDQSISRERTRITRAEESLRQLDNAVDIMISKDQATKGLQSRRAQEQERSTINQLIKDSQNNIDKLLDERMPLGQAMRDIQREVGPIRYVAELIYGRSDSRLLDSAVRGIIILLVLVLDPLSLLLIMTTTRKEEPLDKDAKKKYDIEAKKWLKQNANAVETNGKEWKDMGVIITKDEL